ncbi:hypothetical protein GQ600_13156 [Phytophthora cactorum]|nr:hypothetical protein GQ600_13156 [Phytophthora cactorum]
MYGVIASTLRLFQWYNATILSEWCFILADGFTLVGLSYVITLSQPLPDLKDQRPTSSLIGPSTLLSILGQVTINVIFLVSGMYMLTSQRCSGYLSTAWAPGELTDIFPAILFEYFVVLGPVRGWVRRKFHKDQLPMR